MTTTPQPEPLEAAIWDIAEVLTSHGIDPAMFEDDARKVFRRALAAYEGSESNREDVRLAEAVRAAAPLIAAPIEAVRDAAVLSAERHREGTKYYREMAVERGKVMFAAEAEVADLRARLATAEQDALNRAADDAEASDWTWLIQTAGWLRDRADAAGQGGERP